MNEKTMKLNITPTLHPPPGRHVLAPEGGRGFWRWTHNVIVIRNVV